MTPYQKRLFVFLSVAIFFDGYEMFALSQLLPQLREEFGLDGPQTGALVSFVNIGALASWAVIRAADRFGRRRLLGLTILGYTLASLLTALSPNLTLFALSQLVARIFLSSEMAISMVVAAEEYPAERRGFVLGMMQLFAGAGMIACAAVVPPLLRTPLGWRAVFLVGIVPLLLLAYARRDLRETARFEKVARELKPRGGSILAGPYRSRLLELALVWGLTFAGMQANSLFRKDFLLGERGWSDGEVSAAIVLASLVALPFTFNTGALLDRFGRRLGAMLAYACFSVGVIGGYTLFDSRGLTLCMALTMIGANAVSPLLAAYTTERFPTELRADAFAWSRHLLGNVPNLFMPLVVEMSAAHWRYGPTVAATAICPLLALVLILKRLPETRGLELEETAALKLEGSGSPVEQPAPLQLR